MSMLMIGQERDQQSSRRHTHTREVGVNTEGGELYRLTERVAELEKKHQHAAFHLESTAKDGAKVFFYTGFPSKAYAHLKACFDFWVQELLSCSTETQEAYSK